MDQMIMPNVEAAHWELLLISAAASRLQPQYQAAAILITRLQARLNDHNKHHQKTRIIPFFYHIADVGNICHFVVIRNSAIGPRMQMAQGEVGWLAGRTRVSLYVVTVVICYTNCPYKRQNNKTNIARKTQE